MNLLCDVIFSSLPGQSVVLWCTKNNLQLLEYPWQLNFSNYTKLKQKPSICVSRPIVKTQFKVAVSHYFPVVARSILHFLFYNGQFAIRWVALTAKPLKSYQIKLKVSMVYCKKSVWIYSVTSFSRCCPANLSFLVLQ